MRTPLAIILCLPLLWGPARAEEEEAAGEPPAAGRPAVEITEEEREAALKKAQEVDAVVASLYEQGKYGEAIPLARDALALCDRVLGPHDPQVGKTLNGLAMLLHATGRYAQARPLFERALRINEKSLGAEHTDVATSLNNLAGLLQATGKYAEARTLFERALRIWDKAHGPRHPNVVAAQVNLASVLHAMGLYDEAGPLFERALKSDERTHGPEHPMVAASLNNLAQLRRDTGHYEQALALFERALRIWEKSQGPMHPDVATCLNNLAGLQRAMGQYEQARTRYERSLQIMQSTLGSDHPTVASALNNLAALLEMTGQYEPAQRLYERALTILHGALGPEHPYVATTLGNVAVLLQAMGQTNQAGKLFERTLSIREKAFGPDHPAVAMSLDNLAQLRVKTGAVERARTLSERALRIWEKTLGPEHPDVATSLNNQALLLTFNGLYEAARPLFERALAIYEKAHGLDHPELASVLNNLARVLQEVGQVPRAGELRRRALDVNERVLRQSFMGLLPSERVAMTHSLRGYLDDWLGLAPRLELSGYAEVLRFKGLVTRAMAAERRLGRRSGAEATRRLVEIRTTERRFARLANSMPPRYRREEHRVWKAEYAKTGAKRRAMALELSRSFAPLREGLERLDLKLEDIQAHLGPGSALVDFLRSGDRYFAWIVRSKGAAIRLDLGASDGIDAAAEAFVSAVAEQHGTSRGPLRVPTTEAGDAEAAPGAALRKLVFTPIEVRWGDGIDTVYLCPDAALAAVPFAALPGRVEGSFLIDDYLMVNVSMAQELIPWKDGSKPGEGELAIGGVDYTSASEGAEPPAETTHAAIAITDRAPRGRHFLPLPETRREVAFIETRLGATCSVVSGADATEARVRTASTGKRILHLATHGFVRDDLMRGLKRGRENDAWLGAAAERQLAVGHDPLNLTGLALAGANPRNGGHGDDGILTAAEASYLDLDGVDLVVLSACETARGKAESGEGVIGLVQGFQIAGARRVIASLWRVDDEATRLLMQHLYDGMLREKNPLSPAEALREAAQRLRGSIGAGGRSFSAPRFWGAFVPYGR